MSDEPRIIVVGAGLTGSVAALGLAEAGHNVTVIEPRAPIRDRGRLGVDIRNVALNPASQTLLHTLGVWPQAEVAPYAAMHVWEQWGTGRVEFSAQEVARDEMGWLVEMSALQVPLFGVLQAHPNITLLASPLTSLTPPPVVGVTTDAPDASHHGQIEVICAGRQEPLYGDLLIAADGGRSLVREALGVSVVSRPVHQVALATVVRTEQPHGDVARQRFLQEGPLALLPTQDPHLCSVVWSQGQVAAERRLGLDTAAFMDDIGFCSEFCLGQVVDVDTRAVFPLHQQHLKRPPRIPGVVFIGDAMRVVHPLAGLGVNLGFEDVSALLATVARGGALNDPQVWQRFARQRHARSVAVITLLASFNRLYAQPSAGVNWLRNFGVKSFSAIPGLKQQVMREAMGIGTLSH